MAGKTLDLYNLLQPDALAEQISCTWQEWDNARYKQKEIWRELRNYIFATDTTTTTNSDLPWKNKTTTPKLCQIRDNLFANYWGTLFPKRNFLTWKASTPESLEKAENIERITQWMVDNPRFKQEMKKLVYDYIDHGNVFVVSDWADDRIETPDGEYDKVGYVGAVPRRISPYDIVFNPLAPSFEDSPKIIRQFVTIGEVRKMIEQFSGDPQEKEAMEEVYEYMKTVRYSVSQHSGSFTNRHEHLDIDGYGSFDRYLESGYVELLTFYGDIYDIDSGQLMENYKIICIDRNKIFLKEQNSSFLGKPQIHHTAWRSRPDNLWGMGPLENLVGLQYRQDHVENLKADAFDFMVAPVLKIRGWVEPFEWEPFSQIHIGDEGDVEAMPPDTSILQANLEIQYIQDQMEQMAGAPREALGFRTPGEKTAFEVQRLENAASRIFQIKSVQFEEDVLEPLLNSMLELVRLNNVHMPIAYNDPEFNAQMFQEITPNDIIGNGTIQPMGARHFSEKAEVVQNLNNFSQSALGQDPMVINHFSAIGMAQLMEDLLGLKAYEIVQENVRISEQADSQRLAREQEEQLAVEGQTPAGIAEDDFDDDALLGGEPDESLDGEQIPEG